MSQVLKLQQQAIKAARQQDWAQAATLNQELLTLKPRDLKTMNRLGAAHLQLGENKKAKSILEKVLKFDTTNKLAQKNLERLKQKKPNHIPHFSQEYFIEEPGRSKLIELMRLGQAETLDEVSTGQACQLEPKSSYISINTDDDQYLGALPQDISEKLMSLIGSGNQYCCHVATSSAEECVVFVKEHRRSTQNKALTSF